MLIKHRARTYYCKKNEEPKGVFSLVTKIMSMYVPFYALLFSLFLGVRPVSVTSLDQPDTVAVNKLLELSRNHRSASLDSSVMFAQKALTLAREEKFAKGEGMALHYIGAAYFFIGDYEKSLSFENQAIEFGRKESIAEVLAQAYNAVALINHYKANYPAAIHYFLEALKLEEQRKNLKRIASVRINLTNIYRTMGDFASAKESSRRTLEILDEIPNEKFLLASAVTAEGMIGLELNNYREAMRYFVIADNLFNEVGDTYDVIVASMNRGYCHLRLNELNDAAPFLEKAYRLAQDFKSAQVTVMTMSNLAELKIMQKDFVTGIRLSDEALRISKENRIGQYYVEIYGRLQQGYEMMGNYEKSLRYSQLAFALNDSIKGREISNAIRTSTESYEVWKRQEELNLLNSEARLNEAKLEKEQNFKLFLIILISLLIAIIAVVWSAYQTKARLNAQLKKQNEKINNQNTIIESVNVELQEKALRAQMNPHFIFNCLNSIQYLIVKGDTKNAVEYHSKFSGLLRKMLDSSDVRRISISEEISQLKNYLELECLRLGKDFSFSIVNNFPDVETPLLPPLIIQPLVENALIHGLASKKGEKKLSIDFRAEADMLVCEIRDNGIGRAASAKKNQTNRPQHNSKGLTLSKHRLTLTSRSEQNLLRIIDLHDENGTSAGTSVSVSFVADAEHSL